jgi:hypothetical protein
VSPAGACGFESRPRHRTSSACCLLAWTETIFKRYTIENRRLVQLIGAALVLSFLFTALSPLQRIFDRVALTAAPAGDLPERPDRLSGNHRARQKVGAALG